MAVEDPDDLDRVDHAIRINELTNEAAELTDGEMSSWESDDCPPEIAVRHWENVVAFEKNPGTSNFQQLLDRGIDLPPADDLSDAELQAKLWEVIHALADVQVFLRATDHLSDRELYDLLWSDTLHEWTIAVGVPGLVCHLDLVSSGSDEDNELWLKYYADADARARWHRDWPNDILPPRQPPPFDRDRHLPQPPPES